VVHHTDRFVSTPGRLQLFFSFLRSKGNKVPRKINNVINGDEVHGTEPNLQNTPAHTRIANKATTDANNEHDPYEMYEELEKTMGNNSVERGITHPRVNHQTRTLSTELPVACNRSPHCVSTPAVHTPTSSTKETWRGSRAQRKLCWRSPSEEPTSSEEQVAPRRCLQEEHDTRAPSPFDPRMLGFHPKRKGGRGFQ
jgi:hypothetical protein